MAGPSPLIVCGMGRSGTRNAADILNAHPRIRIHGEIPDPLSCAAFALLDAADEHYASQARGGNDARKTKNRKNLEGWDSIKGDMLMTVFGFMSKRGTGVLEKFKKFKYVGHKSTKAEFYFSRYEKHFKDAGLKPRYVYCARNAEACWRSHKAMTWNKRPNVRAFAAEYAESFAQLDRMRNAAPDRVRVLVLDDIIASPDKIEFYQKKLFDWLGLDLPPDVVEKLRNVKNSNSSINHLKNQVAQLGVAQIDVRDLEAEERDYLVSDPAIAAIRSEFFPHRLAATA